MADAPLSLTFLGSGNAFAAGRYWSSFLVNGRYLFDPSPIVLPHLKKLGLPVNAIDAIFISHFHADHWFGLPFLLLEYAEGSNRSAPLTIVGPPGVEERVRSVTGAGFPNLLDKLTFELRWLELDDGLAAEVPGATFRSREVAHASTLRCFGFRVEIDGRTLAYTGDTTLCPPLFDLAAGADVLVAECSCWDSACGPHLSPRDIHVLRAGVPLTTRFVLTHLDEGIATFPEGILLADDLATVTL